MTDCWRVARSSCLATLILVFMACAATAQVAPAIQYTVSLANPANHLVHVTVDLPPGTADRELQLPVWNSLYQVRDFSQYLNWIKAADMSGRPLPLRELDKSRWSLSGAQNGAEIRYEIQADLGTPYDAQLNEHHAFFHWAEVLLYSVAERGSPQQVKFSDVPDGWRMATALEGSLAQGLSAENYDRLADSPVELGNFEEADFDEGGGHYRIAVDADHADYNLPKIVAMVRSIVATETTWMNDRPFQSYLFIYHFPQGPGGGGMEHSFCTAIDVNVRTLTDSPLALPSVTAHEFFHLWNVKRIVPQALAPFDFTKENYTTSLWFSEGFTSTVEDYALLRAGMMGEKEYFSRLAAQIGELERRPAHLTQSAEESSLGAWLEKYSYYRQPERSISYYNKGALLGVMLDLQMRESSHGNASLRDLFQWMNQRYAQQRQAFPDSDGVRQAADSVSHGDFQDFFKKYVTGIDEIPWDDFLKIVGLRLERHTSSVADLGFVAVRNFNASPVVTRVAADGAAYRAGLKVGDSIMELNGRVTGGDYEDRIAQVRPGETIRLRVKDRSGERELHWKVEKREDFAFELVDLPHLSPQQRVRRAAWLKAEDQ